MPYIAQGDSLECVTRAADSVRKIFQNAQGVFCMSQWLADSMVNTTGVSPDKVHVVYAGANWHGAVLPENIKPRDIAGKKEFHLLLTGISYEGKGADIAVKAVEILNKNTNAEFVLHICGLKSLPVESEYVVNHGFVNKTELIEIISECDLFVLPSRFDCFGIAFVEAMTFGLPCIGRKICAMPEIIDEGVNGELVTSDDPNELVELISKICFDRSLYVSYSASALEKSKKFNWEAVAGDIMKVITNE